MKMYVKHKTEKFRSHLKEIITEISKLLNTVLQFNHNGQFFKNIHI